MSGRPSPPLAARCRKWWAWSFGLWICLSLHAAEVAPVDLKSPVEGDFAGSEKDALDALHHNPERIGPYLQLGSFYNRQGKLDLARSYLLRGLETEPDSPGAHQLLAVNYARRQMWDQAFAHIDKAIDSQPSNPVLFYNRGAFLYNTQRYDEALEPFRKAHEMEPQNLRYHRDYASSLEAAGRHEECLAELTALLQSHTREAGLYYDRAHSWMKLGETEKARLDARKAVSLRPDLAGAHYLLGKIHEQDGESSRALAAYSRVVELEPGHFNARYRLSLMHMRHGDREEGRRQLDTYRSLKDNVDARNAVLRGGDAFRAGNYGAAEAQYREALERDPDNTQALYYLGLIQKRKGQLTEAAESFHKALAVQPDLAVARANLGLTLAGLGQADQARIHLRQAMGAGPDDFEVAYAAGRGYLTLRDFTAAENPLLRSLELWPGHPRVLADLFRLYALWGRIDAARKQIGPAIEANPDDSRLHYLAGLFWAGDGQFDRARDVLRVAARLSPNDVKVARLLSRMEGMTASEVPSR
ncbi:MAG: tetratricopeptide repeat protein [Bryobacterales bacterium]|nr:tetratricopeptide repeat protein [Bryobacterales bacterium]MDE0293937.1 tetratricopeptide repeat protein [Bryobacterales bacterium]